MKFNQFISIVNSMMKSKYGLEPNDFDSPDNPSLKTSYEIGESPAEFVQWYADKHDLTPIGDGGSSLFGAPYGC